MEQLIFFFMFLLMNIFKNKCKINAYKQATFQPRAIVLNIHFANFDAKLSQPHFKVKGRRKPAWFSNYIKYLYSQVGHQMSYEVFCLLNYFDVHQCFECENGMLMSITHSFLLGIQMTLENCISFSSKTPWF